VWRNFITKLRLSRTYRKKPDNLNDLELQGDVDEKRTIKQDIDELDNYHSMIINLITKSGRSIICTRSGISQDF
jgi:hypothetical protein